MDDGKTAAVYKKALSNDKTHVGLFALRNISEGEVIVSEVAKCGQVKPYVDDAETAGECEHY